MSIEADEKTQRRNITHVLGESEVPEEVWERRTLKQTGEIKKKRPKGYKGDKRNHHN